MWFCFVMLFSVVSVIFQCGWIFQCDFQCHILIVLIYNSINMIVCIGLYDVMVLKKKSGENIFLNWQVERKFDIKARWSVKCNKCINMVVLCIYNVMVTCLKKSGDIFSLNSSWEEVWCQRSVVSEMQQM